jgi:hypothetical protein
MSRLPRTAVRRSAQGLGDAVTAVTDSGTSTALRWVETRRPLGWRLEAGASCGSAPARWEGGGADPRRRDRSGPRPPRRSSVGSVLPLCFFGRRQRSAVH